MSQDRIIDGTGESISENLRHEASKSDENNAENTEIEEDLLNTEDAYIHVYCKSDDNVCEMIERCGFSARRHSENSSLTELHESIMNAVISVIFEPTGFSETSALAYQVREAENVGIETFIIAARENSELAKKFEDDGGVTVIKSGRISEIFHLLFVERLCRMPELYSEDRCVRNKYGDIVHHGIDAYKGIAASERFIAEAYMSGEVLPRLYKQSVMWFTRAREHGSIRALVSLGDCYFYGNGCPENRKKAYEMYCEAAEQNSPEGFFRKGVCLFDGSGCDIDYPQAYACFKKALGIRHDFPEAEYYIGVCLRDGLGVEASYTEAKSHFLKSAKGNYTPSLIVLGDLFSDVHGDDRNLTRAFEYYSRAAANGSPAGLYKKGLALSSGDGCEINYNEAYECFSAGARMRDVFCICSLGMCYEFGVGCECDYKKAVECYRTASEGGNAAAMNNLGGCYYYGHGVGKDRKRAFELFLKAANLGDSNAMTRLGLCYENGIDCEKDIKKAFSYFLRAAAQNNAIAAYKAGLCYESGSGTATDFTRAFCMFEAAATLGHVPSIIRTAHYLSDGVGTQKDLWAAYKWYSEGAKQGDAVCCLQLAHFTFKGISTAKNYTKAFSLYTRAYEAGLEPHDAADTALRIGECYLRGLGTVEDREAALEWFKRGAAGGSPDAMFLCGESCYFGSGCARDYEKAVKYYGSAINAGHVRALIELAHCYEEGLGVEKNLKRAIILYKRASEHDNPEADFKLARLMHECGEKSPSTRPLLFKAANSGYIPALLLLGIMYDEGVGIPENSDKASEKYIEAMTLSISKQKTLLFSMPEREREKRKQITEASVEATYRLGLLKGKHSKTVSEYAQAFEYLAGSAATGSRRAQAEIAKIYASGGDLHAYFHATGDIREPTDAAIADAMNKLGDTWYQGKPLLSKNDRAAVKCYRIAAELGQADAAYSLGWCLRHGVGTKVDDVEAAKWLKKSADKGNPYAAYSYGLCCEEGSGMEHPNLRDAATYYRIAAAAGHTDAKKRHIKILENR